MALCLLLSGLSSQAHAADPAATLGVYAGSGQPDAVAAFETRLGRSLTQVHDFQPKDRWSSISDIGWALGRWNASRYAHRVTYSIPMLPDSGATLAEGAAGAYNAHFRTLAQALVAAGDGDAILRLGWEFNGDWYSWSIGAPNGAADYAAYWRQIVTTMRGVPGARLRFDWCANNGSSYAGGKPLDAAAAYPGDAYVDYIGMDVYDQSWSAQRSDPTARWNEFRTRDFGLNWQRSFAAAHGKPISFPEWGLAHRSDGYGGGDEPAFIERMYDWIAANDVAYHDYFEFADSVLDAALFGGRSPRAAARFIELFGPGSAGAALGGGGQAGGPAARGDGPAAGSGPAATLLSVTRARILRRTRRLQLVAPITRLASGSARVELLAGGRRTSFAAPIDRARGRLLVSRAISRQQARAETGIVTITYGGNDRTRPMRVRLRAAPRAARLTARHPSIARTRLRTGGTISRAARGVVRVQLAYDVDGRAVTRTFNAPIRNGRWSLSAALSAQIRDELARRSGGVLGSALYAGYGPAKIGGELRAYEVLGAR